MNVLVSLLYLIITTTSFVIDLTEQDALVDQYLHDQKVSNQLFIIQNQILHEGNEKLKPQTTRLYQRVT